MLENVMAKVRTIRKYFYIYPALYQSLKLVLIKRHQSLSEWVRQEAREEIKEAKEEVKQ